METFSLDGIRGKCLKGRAFAVENPRMDVVFLTGMDEHSLRYEDFARFLNENGISLYVLDAPGQGLNADSPDRLQVWKKGDFDDTVRFANKMVEKLRKERALPVGIMGHSMGSFMVQRYLELFPSTVSFAVMIGSNGPCLMKMKLAFAISSLIANEKNFDKPSHLVQKMGLGAYSQAIKNRKSDFDWLSYDEGNVASYRNDPYCGAVNTNGFWKEFLRGMSELYKKGNLKKIAKEEHLLLLAGEDDPVGEMSKGVIRLRRMYENLGVRDVSCKIYGGMRHEILNEAKKEEVYRDILDFVSPFFEGDAKSN